MGEKVLFYEDFLFELDTLTKSYFLEQKDFIKCERGCSHCCREIIVPMSELESQYLLRGIKNLEGEKLDIVLKNIIKLLEDKSEYIKNNHEDTKFLHDCPFLINDECSVYQNRPIACRTYGLIKIDNENPDTFQMPICLKLGYNYANIWDPSTNWFSSEKALALGIDSSPEAYNLCAYSIRTAFSQVGFGEVKAMLDWLNKLDLK
jgi:Fe-S-cluster containining protein